MGNRQREIRTPCRALGDANGPLFTESSPGRYRGGCKYAKIEAPVSKIMVRQAAP